MSVLETLPHLQDTDVDNSGVNYDALPQDLQEKGQTFSRNWKGFLDTKEGKDMQAQLRALQNMGRRETFFQRILRKLRGG